MAEQNTTLVQRLASFFDTCAVTASSDNPGVPTMGVPAHAWYATGLGLRDHFGFEQLTDLCAVDYLGYGESEWETRHVSSEGFSRGVEGQNVGRFPWGESPSSVSVSRHDPLPHSPQQERFAVVAHIRSYKHNAMVRMHCFVHDGPMPHVHSLTPVWPGANWYEREAFDLFGIIFEGHEDLRRLLTDYGFVGHPMRKDFPLIGNVEVRYDADRQRVVYEPVRSVTPRVGVARVIRNMASEPLSVDASKGKHQ